MTNFVAYIELAVVKRKLDSILLICGAILFGSVLSSALAGSIVALFMLLFPVLYMVITIMLPERTWASSPPLQKALHGAFILCGVLTLSGFLLSANIIGTVSAFIAAIIGTFILGKRSAG